LDALPVSRYKISTDGALEEHVSHREDRFFSVFNPSANRRWTQRVNRIAERHGLPPGYQSELGEQAEAWVASIGERITEGVLCIVDYGYPEAEYYHPQRSNGTLRCHYRHQANDDVYQRIGLQDITAHVDFSALAASAAAVGLTPIGYTQQSAFLLALGITDIAEDRARQSPREALKLANEFKMLTLPQEMGEAFKVLIAGRGISGPLQGFSLSNHLARL